MGPLGQGTLFPFRLQALERHLRHPRTPAPCTRCSRSTFRGRPLRPRRRRVRRPAGVGSGGGKGAARTAGSAPRGSSSLGSGSAPEAVRKLRLEGVKTSLKPTDSPRTTWSRSSPPSGRTGKRSSSNLTPPGKLALFWASLRDSVAPAECLCFLFSFHAVWPTPGEKEFFCLSFGARGV